ncbi:helix-turn-helix domain-containing protein [Bizionia sp.]|uniref:helix-turn-helix domain-containing protein n=1 Tax=Bizionia sp. TaxID=1954480 RepID=UPI003A954C05
MITKTIQIQKITVDELINKVADKLLFKIEHYLKELITNNDDVFLTRTETYEFLKINSSTLHTWTKGGKIKCYGIGSRRYYNKQEILDMLKRNELKI